MDNLTEKHNSIVEGVIWKQLLLFFFPILLGTFFQQLYNTVDAAVVGKFVGKEALAAVGGATGTLINLFVGFFVGLSSGATVIISQFYGAKKEKPTEDSVHTAVAMGIAGGLLLTVVGMLLAPTMLRMMDTPDDVLAPAVTYLRIYFAGMVFNLLYNIGSGILRAIGDSRAAAVRSDRLHADQSCTRPAVRPCVSYGRRRRGTGHHSLAGRQRAAGAPFFGTHERMLQADDTENPLPFDHTAAHHQNRLPAGIQSSLFSISNVLIQSTINAFGTTTMAAWTALRQNRFGVLDADECVRHFRHDLCRSKFRLRPN